MRSTYSALGRCRATVVIDAEVLGFVFVVIGTIFAVMQAAPFAQGMSILLISGMLGRLFAKRPIVLGQGLRTRADVAEYIQEQDGRGG